MTTPDGDSPPASIDLTSVTAIPDCPRCGAPGLLSARIPNGWERDNGQRTNGTTVIVLCAACDADDPTAGALITYFHVHGQVTGDTALECADLIAAWANGIETTPVDTASLDAETEAWRRGELD